MSSKILFINDTSSESNPGCRAVSQTFHQLFFKNSTCYSLPLNFGADLFKSIEGVRLRCIDKESSIFPKADNILTKVNLEQWQNSTEKLFNENPILTERFTWADRIYINAEGSIHHNLPRGICLLGIIAAAGKFKKPIYLMNGSICYMDKELLSIALDACTQITVRGKKSLEEIPEKFHLKSSVVPDLAFAAESLEISKNCELLTNPQINQLFTNTSKQKKYCLLAAGVAASIKSCSELIKLIEKNNLKPIYLQVGDKADLGLYTEISKLHKIDNIDLGKIDFRLLPSLFAKADMAISGRHHLNIFMLKAGLPFIALPSNTWKIEETIELVQAPVKVAHNLETVQDFFSQQQKSEDSHQDFKIKASKSCLTAQKIITNFMERHFNYEKH